MSKRNFKVRKHKINGEVRFPQVRVTSGEFSGKIMSSYEASKIAEQLGLDLILISENASPPVVRIENYNKFLYDLEKREKEIKKNQKKSEVKELTFSSNIADHDLGVKSKKAIEFLSYIEPDSVVYIMLDKEENEYSKILDDYWKKFDPTPETSYNEIMAEFYNRIDYAMREFMGLNKGNGAKTDRGIVYIKFGKPDEIKRTSNPLGQIIEIWTYQKPQRNFSFVDKKGTGNFTLIEE